MDALAPPRAARASRRQTVGLAVLFGTIYFVQGVGEPTDGLLAQPVQSLLRGWGAGPAQLARFAALVAIPWSLKPLYGLVCDFVPIFGSRRRAWLVLSSAVACVTTGVVGLVPLARGQAWLLLALVALPTLAVAFNDVVADALMVEHGQPLGLTGPLQSVQWTCIWAATILTGWLGGWLSAHHEERLGFAVCAALSLVTLGVGLFVLRDRPSTPRAALPRWPSLVAALRSPRVLGGGVFLFLWCFNPFSSTVLYAYVVGPLHLGDQLYGTTVSVFAVASVVAAAGYAFYCRRVSLRVLVHASIVLGIASTLAYAWLGSRTSALVITAVAGLAYTSAMLVQLDLAAQACPPEVAGTVFAVLMSLTNLSESLSTWLGGEAYAWGVDRAGARAAFLGVVLVGAATTACCWLVVPWLRPVLDAPPPGAPSSS